MAGHGEQTFGNGVFGATGLTIAESAEPEKLDIGELNHSISSDEWLVSGPLPETSGNTNDSLLTDGGTPSWSAGMEPVDMTDVRLKHDSVKYSIKSRIEDDLGHVRQYNDHAGDFQKNVETDGSWSVVDRATSSNNTFDISPPISLQPALEPGTFHTQQYRERKSSEDGSVVDVTLRMVRTQPREPSTDLISESQGSGEWLFEFSDGAFSAEIVMATDQGNMEDVEVVVQLTPEQARVLLECATYLDAVTVVEVPDGNDFIRDSNDDGRNTVTITRPSGVDAEYLPTSGADYAIRNWTVDIVKPYLYEARMTVRELQ